MTALTASRSSIGKKPAPTADVCATTWSAASHRPDAREWGVELMKSDVCDLQRRGSGFVNFVKMGGSCERMGLGFDARDVIS